MPSGKNTSDWGEFFIVAATSVGSFSHLHGMPSASLNARLFDRFRQANGVRRIPIESINVGASNLPDRTHQWFSWYFEHPVPRESLTPIALDIQKVQETEEKRSSPNPLIAVATAVRIVRMPSSKIPDRVQSLRRSTWIEIRSSIPAQPSPSIPFSRRNCLFCSDCHRAFPCVSKEWITCSIDS